MGERNGTSDGYRVLSLMLAGPLLYGGIGWLLDVWLHTSWLLLVGVMVGLGLSIYLVISRYGRTV
jgi:F0F1-type ATP synthase assembly protein I